MDGLPVVIRLIDPPLHEFLPDHVSLVRELSDLKIQLQHAPNLDAIDDLLKQVRSKEKVLSRVEVLREDNPMLGLTRSETWHSFPGIT